MFHLITQSTNSKVGLGVAVSTSTAATCPDSCPLKKAGCYADSGPLALHWRKVTAKERGHVWNAFIKSIQALPVGWKFRHNQAGDLPGENNRINRGMLRQLATAVASRSLRAWTYTHKPLTKSNLEAIREANANGLVINLSADNLKEADRKAATGLPVTVILPRDSAPVTFTPQGRKVVTCPAQTRHGTTCSSCMLCQRGDRSVIVGFKVHGNGAKKAEKVALNS
jgi:hypothetical protein